MPLYSYKGTNCDHEFEIRQRFADEPLTECPVCAGPVRRIITPVGIVFKGSGFYVTDNRNGKANVALNGSGPKRTEKSEGETTTTSTTDEKVIPQKKGSSESTATSSAA